MKHNRNKLLILFTALLIFMWSEGFQLRAFQFSERYFVLRIASVFLIVFWSVIRTSFANYKPLFRNFYFRSILGLVAVVILPTFFTGTLLYGQGLGEVVRRPLFFYALFIFVPLFYYPTDISTLKRLNMLIVVIGVSVALFQSVFSFVPDIGKIILNDSAYIASRFELTRMTAMSAMVPCVLYATFYLITAFSLKKNSIFCALGLVILLYYIFFVFMSRSTIFGLGIVLLLFYIFYQAARRQLLLWGLLVLLLLILSQSFVKFGPIDMIKESAISIKDEMSSVDGTIGHRIRGIQYYWHEFQKTWYVGIGLVSPIRGTDTSVGIGMTEYSFGDSDQGIFSVIMQFGFQALILTGVICYRMFRDLQSVIRYGISDLKIIAISIQLYLLSNIVTLSHIFLWHFAGIWWGIFFYMVWAIRTLASERITVNSKTEVNNRLIRNHALNRGL